MRTSLARKNVLIAIGLFAVCVFWFSPLQTSAQAQCTFVLPVVGSTATTTRQGDCPSGYTAGSVIVRENLTEASWTEMIYRALSGLGSMIAWLGGGLLNISISLFTVGMADTAEEWGFTNTIEALWAVIRDLFNIVFIFGLIWAGLKLVLGSDDSRSKKMIVSIVIAALLINFSLYATQVVVDFSNVAAYQIHSALKPADGSANVRVFGFEVANIADNFVNMANVDRLRNNNQELANASKFPTDTFVGSLILGIVMLLFYGLLGFVFAAGAFILFSRFIALLFLMIFSPVLFLGWILPNMKSVSDKWVKYLFSQALVGPAYLFMLYIALRAMEGMGQIEQLGVMSMMVYVLIVAAFLIAALKTAQSMSNWGSLQAYNVGSALERRFRVAAGGATAGLAARGLRSSLGWGAQKISENESLRDAASGRGIRGWAARRTFNASSKLGDATFDVRNTQAGKGLAIGEGLKGGYKSSVEEIAKQEKAFAEKLGTVNDDDERVATLQLDVDATEQGIKSKKESIQSMRKELAGLAKEEDRRKKRAEIETARAELEDMEEKHGKQKEELQKEKQRRQLGFDSKIPEHYKNDINDRKKRIKENQVKYATLNSKKADDLTETEKAERDTLRETITKEKKELAAAEKDAAKHAGGYAQTVAGRNILTRLFMGRTKATNENAGKEIRDEYKKKIKSKDK